MRTLKVNDQDRQSQHVERFMHFNVFYSIDISPLQGTFIFYKDRLSTQ